MSQIIACIDASISAHSVCDATAGAANATHLPASTYWIKMNRWRYRI